MALYDEAELPMPLVKDEGSGGGGGGDAAEAAKVLIKCQLVLLKC